MESVELDIVAIGTPPPKPITWRWSSRKITAVGLFADDCTIAKAAEILHVSTTVLERWRRAPEFKARIQQVRQAWDASVMSSGIARKSKRVALLQRLQDEQIKLFESRQLQNGNGLVAIEPKMIGERIIDMEVFDGSLNREMRATVNQAAEETGQLVSRTELSGPDGGPLQITIGVLDDIAERVRLAKMRRNQSVTVTQVIPEIAS